MHLFSTENVPFFRYHNKSEEFQVLWGLRKVHFIPVLSWKSYQMTYPEDYVCFLASLQGILGLCVSQEVLF